MKTSLLLAFAGFFFVLAGCNQSPKKDRHNDDTPTTGEVTIAVDETYSPVIDAALPVFHSLYKFAHIQTKYLPEVDALNLLLKDSVRLAIVSRPLSVKELDYFHSKKFFPKVIPIGIDGIAVLVNPANPDTLFSVETIRKIMMGEITSWKELNKKSPLGKVKVIFDNPKSSIVRFIVDSITKSGNLSKQLSSMQSNLDVVDFVSQNPDAIGLIGVSWVSNRNDPKSLSFLRKIKVAGISVSEPAMSENSYQPFQAYIATGKYPFTRFLYALLSEPRPGLGTGFTSFLASDKGQRIIQKTGILPITLPVRIVHITEE
jgi:phosphate transport system substrate-binding protein